MYSLSRQSPISLVTEILNNRESIGNNVMNAERRAPSPDPIRLLLVDDSQDDHRLLCDLLDAVNDVSYAIDWAKDLSTGRDRLENGRFDVCLIDHRLPEGDGLELLETAAVRGFPAPMILLTGHGSAKLDQRAMTLGASGFLDKNRLDSTLLERTIRYAMQQQKIIRSHAHAALRDDATGLITPILFRDRLARALAVAKRRQSLVALVLIDLGQERAPETDLERQERQLTVQAKRLVRHLRETDSVARLADQRLALILESLQCADDAALVARKTLDKLTSPVVEDDETLIARPSAGIAIYPEDCGDIDTLLRQADDAMRRAKAEEGHGYRFGSERVDHRVQRQFLLSDDLKRALDQETFTLRYRPSVHVANTAISLTAEVYSNKPENKHISTDQFLSIAHNRSLIASITDWIVGEAISQLLAWRYQGFERVDLSLPFVSTRPVDLPILERSIRRHLGKAPISPDHIEIDLGQNLVISDLASGGHGLAALKATGVRLALDDFGRHDASFHHLANDLLDSLKLSSRLYHDLPGDTAHETLLKAIISLGHDLDLRVMADGARDEHQFAFLKGAGCDAIKLRAAKSSLTADMFTSWLQKTKPPLASGKARIVVKSQITSGNGQTCPAEMGVKNKEPLSPLDTR